MTKQITGDKFKVLGTSDYPVCDCCGKTNLTRAVGLENEGGETFNVGVICASKLRAKNTWARTTKCRPTLCSQSASA